MSVRIVNGYGLAALSAFAVFLITDQSVDRFRAAHPFRAAPAILGSTALLAVAAARYSLLVAIVGPLVAGLALSIVRSEAGRRARLAQQRKIPAVVEVLARLLATGLPVSGALDALTADQLQVLDLGPVVDRVRSGERVADVLAGADGLVSAALLAAELSGGNSSVPLERLSDRLRWAALDGRAARSLSGQQLASAAVMAVFPMVVAAFFALSDRRAAHFYLHTWWGVLSIGVSLILSYLAWIWMRYLTRGASQ